MAAIKLSNIRKQFGRRTVLDSVSLEIHECEFMVFVGPSGCGKTTLLRVIAGFETPDSGEVHIGNRRVEGLPPGEREVAMVFQNYALYPHMTAAENLSFCLKNAGVPGERIQERVTEVAKVLQIESLLERRPHQMSGGQRQRVAIGRAIIRSPKVYLFDEPLSNLDALLRMQTRVELASLHQRFKTTTIYVTHDQMEAMTLADRIAVMNEGHIEQVGSPLELYFHPANRFVAGFLGSPPMNFIPASVTSSDGERSLVLGGKLQMQLPEKFSHCRNLENLTAGIRAEHLRIDAREGFPATVLVVEHLGSHTLIYCETGLADAGKSRLVLELKQAEAAPDSAQLKPGSEIHVNVEHSAVHLFDSSGQSLAATPQYAGTA